MSPARVTQVRYVAYAAIALGIVIALVDSVLGFMVLPVTIGAAGIAMVLAILHARPGESEPPVDRFRNLAPTDVINAAHIRVAGVGGLGLVFMSALIAIQFPRVGMTMVIGLAGGIPLAFYLVRRHRHQRDDEAATNGPGGRSVFPMAARSERTSSSANVKSEGASSGVDRSRTSRGIVPGGLIGVSAP